MRESFRPKCVQKWEGLDTISKIYSKIESKKPRFTVRKDLKNVNLEQWFPTYGQLPINHRVANEYLAKPKYFKL